LSDIESTFKFFFGGEFLPISQSKKNPVWLIQRILWFYFSLPLKSPYFGNRFQQMAKNKADSFFFLNSTFLPWPIAKFNEFLLSMIASAATSQNWK
jgi:hypothetical protein